VKSLQICLAIGVLCLAAALRAPLLTRQGLWADEVFSLAIATGHSLEHPHEIAESSSGDFIEPDGPVPKESLARYLRHEQPPCAPGDVVRAVALSDTSPPLYYLVLWAWSRALGTSDAALRGLSLVAFLLSMPFLGALARRVGGRSAVLPALLLYACNPVLVYYSTEGRQYSLMWLWVLASAWAAVGLRARGASAIRLGLFVVASAAGLLTHYFFVFAWAPMVGYLWIRPHRLSRVALGGALAVVALAALPWYAQIGDSLARWRITGGWLEIEPAGFDRREALLDLVSEPLGGADFDAWGERRNVTRAAHSLIAALVALTVLRLGTRFHTGARGFVVVWLLGAWLGPLLFDAWFGTYTVANARYAMAWVPAGMLLLGSACATVRPAPRLLWLGAACALWALQFEVLLYKRSRSWCPLREAATAAGTTSAEDLVLVHSIPSGVLGVARYLQGDAPVGAWIGQLGRRRIPEAIEHLVVGRRSVHFIRVHEVGEPAPEEAWLREHGSVVGEFRHENAYYMRFAPRHSATF
jgi:hypothetical protein